MDVEDFEFVAEAEFYVDFRATDFGKARKFDAFEQSIRRLLLLCALAGFVVDYQAIWSAYFCAIAFLTGDVLSKIVPMLFSKKEGSVKYPGKPQSFVFEEETGHIVWKGKMANGKSVNIPLFTKGYRAEANGNSLVLTGRPHKVYSKYVKHGFNTRDDEVYYAVKNLSVTMKTSEADRIIRNIQKKEKENAQENQKH